MTRASGAPALATREKPPAPPQQKRSIERRRKLMESARTLFGKKGFEGTSIEDIAEGSGAAVGAFYIYFRSKRQILVALMNELLKRLAEVNLAPRGSRDVQAGLRAFLKSAFDVDMEYFGVVRAWQEASLTDPELGRMQKQIQGWTEARIEGVFAALQRHPSSRRGRDISTFAKMMDRHFWSLLARGSKMPAKDMDREITMAADVIYHYLFRDGEAGQAAQI